MNAPFLDTTWKNPAEVHSEPISIRSGGSFTLPRSDVRPHQASFLRRYANESLNSRVAVTVPEGRWRVRWKAELDDGLRPRLVLSTDLRVLVQGHARWQLLSTSGEALAADYLGQSDVVLDPEQGLIYAMDRDGYLAAWQIKDGSLSFLVKIDYGSDFSRILIARRGGRMIVAGVEREIQPHEDPPNESLVEIFDIGDPPQLRPDRVVDSMIDVASLMRRSANLSAALDRETLVIATDGHLYRADENLNLNAALTGSFTPLSLSLGEAGFAYLVVLNEAGLHALWVVSPDGDLMVDAELSRRPGTPPIIGYDQRIYLVIDERLHAFGPGGEPAWAQHAGAPIAGAIVTADDRVLVAAGDLIQQFEPDGERTVLLQLEGARWTTPPVLTEQGRILVATGQHLYCLEIAPQASP